MYIHIYIIYIGRNDQTFSRNYEIFSRNNELISREFNFKHDTKRFS